MQSVSQRTPTVRQVHSLILRPAAGPKQLMLHLLPEPATQFTMYHQSNGNHSCRLLLSSAADDQLSNEQQCI